MVGCCRCADGPIVYPLNGDEDDAVTEQLNATNVADWTTQRSYWGHTSRCLTVVPAYSTDIAAAWEVVEKMREYGWGSYGLTIAIVPQPSGMQDGTGAQVGYEIKGIPEMQACVDQGGFFRKPRYSPTGLPDDYMDDVIASAPTAPHAICLAALRAVGAS